MPADLAAYLRRIGYDAPLAVNLATLRALHRAHLMAIPYENLDVQLGGGLTIDPAAAFEKLVGRGRGGWCYEMNGAFGLALDAAGFQVKRLTGETRQPCAHLALAVDLAGERWICDVGYGDGPIEPYRLAEGPFDADGFVFRVELLRDDRWRFHNHRFGAGQGFTAGPGDEEGMAATCRWLQRDPASTFVQHATIFLRLPGGGYISLIDRTLRTVSPERVEAEVVADADAYVALLKHRFGLDAPQAGSLWPALCERHEAYQREAAASRAAAAG